MKPIKNMFIVIAIILFVIAGYYCWPETALPEDTKVDLLVVYKSKRKLLAYADGKLIKTYTISLGSDPIGHKAYEGDMKTPEGIYTINAKNANSGYHKNLGVSYPNDADREAAAAIGKKPGGDIKIHGLRNGRDWIGKLHRWTDWTHGCMAVTDREMDELFDAVAMGTPIEIKP
ncbi:MAG: hypothetical protein CFE23_08030 [Flavobacterium sp. BFFFF1]|uniref:L,D-transpeptidase family protein n=1 Tax=Flavobacterium sp. BFFFF1 TaxID=2015557 RepID=UPI000BC558B7|nr:L,D-transpeptidase family protein [Flavobacterium sp. BFFFF1]OYU80663.1 MAG: hypothetical protein CFE23_08030 [Flavobacterium sp. BFFFF1]